MKSTHRAGVLATAGILALSSILAACSSGDGDTGSTEGTGGEGGKVELRVVSLLPGSSEEAIAASTSRWPSSRRCTLTLM